MMIALNVNADNRILCACVVLNGGNYDGMPLVGKIPEGNLYDYLYIDGEFIYDPMPVTEQTVKTPDHEERIKALEEENKQLKEALDLLLSGASEEEGEVGG